MATSRPKIAELCRGACSRIVKNHRFVDAKKGAGFNSDLILLEVNSHALSVRNEWITVVENFARGEMTRAEFVDRLAAEEPSGGPVHLDDG